MNLKKSIGYLTLFTLILSLANCRTTQISRLDDFSFLNGQWIQPCDSLLTGEYKGEVECVMLEEDATSYTIDIVGNKGFLIRHLLISKDTTFISFKYNSKNELMVEYQSKFERWQRSAYQVDSSVLKLYNEDRRKIEFFERIPD